MPIVTASVIYQGAGLLIPHVLLISHVFGVSGWVSLFGKKMNPVLLNP